MSEKLTVAELLARNAKAGGTPASGRPRRRRNLEDGGVSVSELTGSIPVVVVDDAQVGERRQRPDTSVTFRGAHEVAAAKAVGATEAAESTDTTETVEATEVTEVAKVVDSAEVAEATKVAEVAEGAEVAEVAEVVEATKVAEVVEAAEVAGTMPAVPAGVRESELLTGLVRATLPDDLPVRVDETTTEDVSEVAPEVASEVQAEGVVAEVAEVADDTVDAAADEAAEDIQVTGDVTAAESAELAEVAESAAEETEAAESVEDIPADTSGDGAPVLPADSDQVLEYEDDSISWPALIGQSVIAVLVGVLVFFGFTVLWDNLDTALVLVLALVVTFICVGVVHALLRHRDTLLLVLTFVVGIALTVGPRLILSI